MHWYRHRLAAMSFAEITHRLSEAVKRRLDRQEQEQERERAAHDCGALPSLPELRAALTAWNVPASLLREWEADAAAAQAGKFFLLARPGRQPRATGAGISIRSPENSGRTTVIASTSISATPRIVAT